MQALSNWRALLSFMLAAGLCATASAQNSNTVYASGQNGMLFDTTLIGGLPALGGAPGPINMGNLSGEAHYALASGETLSLRALVASRGGSNQAETRSSFDWITIAGAGSSGLQLGDPFRLTISFHIDGRTAAGYGAAFVTGPIFVTLPADFTLQSYSTASLRLDVYDLSSPDYEDGAPLARADYVAGANLEAGLYSPSPSYPTGAAYTNLSSYVQLGSNDPLAGNTAWAGNTSDASNVADVLPVKLVYDVNTGLQSVSIDTFVGHSISLRGTLWTNLYCASYAPVGSAPSCAGLVDYANTFDAELSANVAGLSFSNYSPGIAPAVPEPASAWLMLGGVGALLVCRRRALQALELRAALHR